MKQINLQSPILKESFKYLGWVLLFLFLWFKGCSDNNKQPIASVIVPEVKGNFKPVTPEQTPVSSKMEPTKKNNFGQNQSNEFLQNQISQLLSENDKLNLAYLNASDSLKKALYDKSIQINSFTHTWNNDTIQATASGIVRGEVQSIGLKYTIKERRVQFSQPSQKETVFRLLGGVEIGNNATLSNPVFKVNLGFQNRKGNVLTASYDNNKNIYVGYMFSILNIKR